MTVSVTGYEFKNSAEGQVTQVSVAPLLPEGAEKPLDRNLVLMVARGLVKPGAGLMQRIAIEYCKLKGWS